MDSTNTYIPLPQKYQDKWLIWPKTVLSFMNNADCDDTINGICLKNKTVTECVSECKGECGAGYHVQFENGNTICVPIRTAIHPYLNPVYRLQNQNMYPQLKNVQVSTFVNREKFPFPPNWANAVFYHDILNLQDVKTKLTLSDKNGKIQNKDLLYMNSKRALNIELIPAQISTPQIVEYVPVRYGDLIRISIPATSLLATVDTFGLHNIHWEINSGISINPDIAFKIVPVTQGRQIGDIISYSDHFKILYQDTTLVMMHDKTKQLHLKFNTNQNEDNDAVFTFISKMTGYYCKNGNCEKVPISDIETDYLTGTYKGAAVSRNPHCWGFCDFSVDDSLDFQPYEKQGGFSYKMIILSIVIIAILSIINIWFRKNR